MVDRPAITINHFFININQGLQGPPEERLPCSYRDRYWLQRRRCVHNSHVDLDSSPRQRLEPLGVDFIARTNVENEYTRKPLVLNGYCGEHRSRR